MSGLFGLARLLTIIGLIIGYAFLAHYTNSRPGIEMLGTLLALAPLVAAALSMAWHAAHRMAMMGLFCIGCVALWAAWPRLVDHYSMIFWLEHAGTELMLCALFGRTLHGGREAMCTYFARIVHGGMTPPVARYTRQVTHAWVWFFGTMAAVSTLLFFSAPLHAWSMFANFFTGPLIGLMFVAEYLIRRQLLPDMEHAHFLDAIKAFWKVPAR